MCKWGTDSLIEINGRTWGVDSCIEPLVKALNDAHIKTVASCCSHGKGLGSIVLRDGRELLIAKDFKEARKICDWYYRIRQRGD